MSPPYYQLLLSIHVAVVAFTITPSDAVVREGMFKVFACATSEESQITWQKNGRRIQESNDPRIRILANGYLRINPVNVNDSANYTCVAYNFRTKCVTKHTAKLLFYKDVNEVFAITPSDAVVREGVLKEFACVTLEESRITWQKNGRRIQQSNDPRIRILGKGYLRINPVNVNDSAKYTCVAYNFRTKCVNKHTAKLRVYNDVNEVCGQAVLHQPGESLPKRIGYIVGGQEAMLGAAPWQVMLYESLAKAFCSGVLVSNRWVITAAHCFVEFQKVFRRSLTSANLVLKLGKHKRQQRSRYERHVKMARERIHSAFDAIQYNNDIALIELEHEVEFSDYIRPICLTRSQTVIWNITAPGTFGIVTGWGKLTEDGKPPELLNEVSLPVVRQAVCVSSTKLSISDNMFCAGYARDIVADACMGDSGGPFSVEYLGRWYLVGLVSWGEGCALSGKFGFYTNVTKYMDWLAERMGTTTMTTL